jgi:hypothetical protein
MASTPVTTRWRASDDQADSTLITALVTEMLADPGGLVDAGRIERVHVHDEQRRRHANERNSDRDQPSSHNRLARHSPSRAPTRPPVPSTTHNPPEWFGAGYSRSGKNPCGLRARGK